MCARSGTCASSPPVRLSASFFWRGVVAPSIRRRRDVARFDGITRHHAIAATFRRRRASIAATIIVEGVAATPSPRDFTSADAGGDWGLFGLHTVSDDASELVITEGEYDAMAVYQATGRAAVSLPNGAASLPPAVLPLLERFKRIFLWCDGDEVPARRPSPVFLWSGGVGWGGTTRSGATTGTPSPRPVRTCGRGAHEPTADLGERPPHAIDA